MKRFAYDLSHLSYTVGQLGHLLPLTAIPTVAGDTISINLEGALRLAPLRHFLTMDANVHIAAYHVKNRHCYPDEQWENMIKDGRQYNSGGAGALDTITNTPVQEFACIPGVPRQGTIPAHYLRGLNAVWNNYYRIPNVTAEWTADTMATYTWDTDQDARYFGPICARLPEFWNTGLEDSMYDATTYAEVGASAGAGAINLLDLADVMGEYQSEIQRDWFDKRYRDLMQGGWGTNGVSVDADERPEILMVEEGFLSGHDIDAHNASQKGTFWGKSQGVIDLNIPPKYFSEHGMIWIFALVRFPSVIQEHVHYLSNRTLEYTDIAGDPRVVKTQPPVELTKDDFIEFATAGTTSWGWHPHSQWYRTHPSHISFKLNDIAGYPFINADFVDTDNERYYDMGSSASFDTDYFSSTSEIGGAHYSICANVNVEAKRVIPPATESIYAGAHSY